MSDTNIKKNGKPSNVSSFFKNKKVATAKSDHKPGTLQNMQVKTFVTVKKYSQ